MPETATVETQAPEAPAQSTTETAAPPDWRASLPDDLRDHPVLKDYKTLDGAIRGYVEQAKLIGRKTEGMVKVPGANATPEEQQAFRKALGVPESADKYTFELADEFEPIVPKEARERWASFFHKEGVPPATAQRLVTMYAEDAAQQKIALQQSFRAAQDTLRESMGSASHDRYLAMAESGVKYVVSRIGEEKGAQFKAMLDDTLLGDHPLLVEVFTIIGRTLAEDGHVPVEGVGGSQLDTAKEYIAASYKKDHPAMNERDPGHEAAVARRREAFQLVTQFDPTWRPFGQE